VKIYRSTSVTLQTH